MTGLQVADYERARLDAAVFADLLLGQPLWGHQLEVVRSPARYRVLCAGRRSGKTRVFGVLALHRAFAVPGSKVLIVSASETSAKRMFADVSGMVTSAMGLASSVDDETTHQLVLSNRSTVECVPSSMKAVRSAEADLLIVDEAGFVDQEIWEAAEPVVGARPGARVLVASTPWRGPGHFFHDLYKQGCDRPDAEVESWHWATTANPLTDLKWLEGVRQRSASDYFKREYLAEWGSESGSYFDEDELMACVADYELLDAAAVREVSPLSGGSTVRSLWAVGGVDWGMRRDANALALVSPLEDGGVNAELLGPRGRALFVPYLVAESGWQWDEFAAHVAEMCSAYYVQVVASEVNGVGDAATRMLFLEMQKRARGVHVLEVWTDMRRKQAGFGKIKLLLQRGLLVLPRHPELLKQLRALEFEQTAAGGVRIAVPEARGHDDLALALMQAVSCVQEPEHWGFGGRLGAHERRSLDRLRGSRGEGSVTGRGLWVPARPLPARVGDVPAYWMSTPQGQERGEAW